MRASLRHVSRTVAGLAVLAAALGVAGCCNPVGRVSGKVSYKGSPLKGGHVVLLQPNKQSISADIGEDGSYSFDKVVTGQCKVAVETSSLKPPTGGARRFNPAPADAQGQSKQSQNPEEMAKRYVQIPEKY